MKIKGAQWRAVRKGTRYCSPACGRGCSYVEFQDAAKKAAALCRNMGRGWAPRVWENGGWHFSATSPCGRITLHDYGASATAFFNGTGFQFVESKRTPKGAYAAVLRVAKTAIKEMNAALVNFSPPRRS